MHRTLPSHGIDSETNFVKMLSSKKNFYETFLWLPPYNFYILYLDVSNRMEPPVQPKEGAVVEVVQDVVALADARQSRKLQRWREEQK